MSNQILEKLWSIGEVEAKKFDCDISLVFDPIGLILYESLECEGYESTPTNSLAFARTGGDGVHYSLLILEGEVSDDSPVVMTVPMNFGQENLIVGSDMKEFLCLGCQVGYFSLEQLTYDKTETIYWINHPDEWFREISKESDSEGDVSRMKYLLRLLREGLDLKPWEEFEQRIKYLQKKYFSLLKFSSRDLGSS